MKNTLLIGLIAAACVTAAVTGIVISGSGSRDATADVAQNDRVILSELKVGRYYLEGGSDEQYIEVFDDRTMCLFGDSSGETANEVQKEEAKKFTSRRYYYLNETIPFIGLSDEPNADEIPNVGYTYDNENVINFTNVIDNEYLYQKYVFKED